MDPATQSCGRGRLYRPFHDAPSRAPRSPMNILLGLLVAGLALYLLAAIVRPDGF